MTRYDIYLSGDAGDMTAVIRDNECLLRGDLQYTWTEYHIDNKKLDELKAKYKDYTIYFN